jgi:hypothetical protein
VLLILCLLVVGVSQVDTVRLFSNLYKKKRKKKGRKKGRKNVTYDEGESL